MAKTPATDTLVPMAIFDVLLRPEDGLGGMLVVSFKPEDGVEGRPVVLLRPEDGVGGRPVFDTDVVAASNCESSLRLQPVLFVRAAGQGTRTKSRLPGLMSIHCISVETFSTYVGLSAPPNQSKRQRHPSLISLGSISQSDADDTPPYC